MGEKLLRKNTLDIQNDLNLSAINFPKFQKNVVVPQELNNYLRDQLEQMKRENDSLQQELLMKESQLHESQMKIQDLTEKYSEYEECGDFTVSASQVAHRKIVELSKKLREKNAEIEVFKSKNMKLENSLVEIMAKNEIEQKTAEKQETVENDVDEVKKIKDKLTFIRNKWIEEKNLNLQLKNDLKRANKWLQQEVGDKFETLLVLNNSNSSWRGRAQIICDLQQKNQELREKLKGYEENDKERSLQDSNQNNKSVKKIEELNKENSELKESYNELKQKFSVLKTRCKVLVNDHSQLKTKLTALTKVHETDQKMISELSSQVSHYNDLRDEDLKQKDELIKKLQQEIETLKVELNKEKCLSENMSRDLLEKNDDIQVLNRKLKSSRPPSSYSHRSDNNEGKVINKLEVERMRLLELTDIQNSRLQEERDSHFTTQHLLRVEKQKCAKLEAKMARLQLEQTSSRSSYGGRDSIPKSIEYDIKDKLELAEENIKALTTRLEIESLERKRDLQEFSKILKNCSCH